jgi:hypothetical protein
LLQLFIIALVLLDLIILIVFTFIIPSEESGDSDTSLDGSTNLQGSQVDNLKHPRLEKNTKLVKKLS